MSVKNKDKKKKPFPQVKVMRDVPIDEISDHLIVLFDEGYTEWNILDVPIREVRKQYPRDGDGIIRTDIERSETVHLIVWWTSCPHCDDDSDED